MTDRNGNSLTPGDRVVYQIHPRKWRSGTVGEDGRTILADYDGTIVRPWEGGVRRCRAA